MKHEFPCPGAWQNSIEMEKNVCSVLFYKFKHTATKIRKKNQELFFGFIAVSSRYYKRAKSPSLIHGVVPVLFFLILNRK